MTDMKQMNILKVAAVSAFAAVIASGCSESDIYSAGSGSLMLTTAFRAPAATDAAPGETPDAENLMVWISSSRGLIRRYDSRSEIPSSVTLKAGTYLAEAWAGDSVPASFTQRYFKGSRQFDIVAGSKSRVDLVCHIANVVVTVEYSDDMDERMSEYTLTVANGGGSVEFIGRDDRKAYFMMDAGETTLEYELKGIKANGESYSQKGTVNGVKPATEYNISVTPDDVQASVGAAFFNVAVDTATIDEVTSIEILLSPSVSGKDFDIRTPLYVQPGQFSDLAFDVFAYAAIRSAVVSCPSFVSTFGFESIDLMAMSPEISQIVNAAGLTHTYDYEPDTEVAKMIVNVAASMLNTLPEGEYPLTFTISDANGKTSVTTLLIKCTFGNDPVAAADIDGTADVWATRATLRGTVLKPADASSAGFRYRAVGAPDWTEVAAVISGNSFSAQISGLTPGTEYEVLVTAPDYVSMTPLRFTTEAALSIPNGDFEIWNTSSTPYLLGADTNSLYWDSGNHGSAKMGKNITTPESAIKHGGQYSAKLASQFVGVGILGKFAAGNAFVGKYLDTDGTDGILGMGRPFTSRPSALKGYVRYEPASISYSSVSEAPKGTMDKGVIYAALMTDESLEEYNGNQFPFVIKTKKAARLFDRDDPRIIAFGEIIFTEKTAGSGLVEFTLPLDYRRADAKASYLVLTCSASYWGDYFTGGPSVMYLDDFEFIYE